MDLFYSFLTGIGDVFSPVTLMVILVGSVISTIVGIIPTIGGVLVVTLTIPFISGLDPLIILPFLIALDAVSCTGGSVTAILLNVPGDIINAATAVDGYQMTKKGQSGRAIGAALTSSAIGGVLTVPMALLMVPILVKFILLFRSPEMFLLILVGLCCIAVLTTKGHELEGLISAFLGILFSCIGAQASTGIGRFTFDYVYLYEGIPVPIATLGIFAVPALIGMLTGKKKLSISDSQTMTKEDRKQMWQGVLDVWKYKWLALRSMVIGYVIGVLPAVGAGASTFMCYSLAKKGSKHPEEFGHGTVEGVIAPEAANNAKEAGAMLTTLALGIPGSATMAIMMSALIVLGITPGPSMLTKQTPLVISMLVTIAVANIFAVIVVWLLGPKLTKLTRVNPIYLFAGIIPLVMIGAFSKDGFPVHLLFVVGFGVLGYFFRKYHYSGPSFILGFILGDKVENYFWRNLSLTNDLSFLFSSPICIILLAICILVVFSQPIGTVYGMIFKRNSKSAVSAV